MPIIVLEGVSGDPETLVVPKVARNGVLVPKSHAGFTHGIHVQLHIRFGQLREPCNAPGLGNCLCRDLSSAALSSTAFSDCLNSRDPDSLESPKRVTDRDTYDA